MTSSGTGVDSSATSSARPRSANASTSRSTVAWIFGSIALAAAPLVSGAIRARKPACSGGSWSIGGNRLSETAGTYTPPVEE
ncbi:hypothetical protein [Pseudonocardia sp. T1-2H]|uniref:hypothetical protein n=1 Tax=Pseudonocardia sp. T1-2H TaxID=3128899 RepID=UPI003100D032